MSKEPLTPNEGRVFEFIKSFTEKKGYAPSFTEIQDQFNYRSIFSVQQYINQLVKKGHLIAPGGNKKRALEIAKEASSDRTSIPLLGRVAAGKPLEAALHDEFVEVGPEMVSGVGEFFALQVKGDSMINDGIMEDDIVIIKKQPTAFNGQTVVALIDNEATIKCFFKKKNAIELHSANPKYKPIIVGDNQSFSIEGILHGLIRKFKR